MNFKEALIAHLQGEMVEVKTKGINEPWEPLFSRIKNFTLSDVDADNCGMGCEFRLAPRTIRVNGVEVPAPERVAPGKGACFFAPDFEMDEMFVKDIWSGTSADKQFLQRGLVYLTKEDAIARAKAMLLTQE